MASGGQQFPSQTQEKQPGKEHVMEPTPQFAHPEYKPANKLHGKVALITGGDSGIGRAVAHLFALEGATVAITYVKGREEKDALDTIEIIRRAKTKDAKDPIAIAADVGYDEICRRVVEEVVNSYGRIDILVNNAAEQHMSTVEEIDEPRLERVFRTNIFSHFFMVRHALKHMKEGSSIICTTSVNAYQGNPSLIDCTATKGAIVAFVRALSLHHASKGIRVNGVAPGPIWTPLIPASSQEGEACENFGTQVPIGRAGQPMGVAPAYVFLADDGSSSYISGQVIHPNGGAVING